MEKIKVENSKARPVNPHSGSSQSASFLYATFEDTIQWHDCPECEDGEYEAELVWQHYNSYGRYWTDCSQRTAEMYCDGTDTRQVWRIVPQPQEKNLSLKASMKFERLIHNNPKPDGDSKGKRLGHFVYDHEKQTETFIPITQKEEAKTVEGKKLLKYEFEVIDGVLHCVSHTQNVTLEEVHEALIMVKDHIYRHIAKRHECPFYNPNNAGIDGRFKI